MLTSFSYVPGVKRDSVAFGRVVLIVDREVTPPLAIVVPEVVVGVLPVDSDRQF